MDLPTYTSIWRIEKRLYKLYDFRLPMPVPVGQMAVFAAITVPYVVLLTLLGWPGKAQRSSELPARTGRSERLADLTRAAGAGTYICGTGGSRYLDQQPFAQHGLSVLDVYGQWQGKTQTSPERLRSKLLMIDYPDTQLNRDKIDAIRAAWKKLTGDQSVLRVTQPADVSF